MGVDRKDSINVLYIDGDGPLGGASRSLYELIGAFEPEAVRPFFLTSKGTAEVFYKKIAAEIISVRGMPKFDHTRYGYYRGWRWLILLREFVYFPFMLVGLFSARRRFKDVDIIHLNEFVYLLPAILAKKIFSAPLVVHVRALTKGRESGARSFMFNWLLRRFSDVVVAIDGNVRETLPKDLEVLIVNNSFSLGRERDDPQLNSILRKIPEGAFKAGFVGNLHKSKGVIEILQAAKILRQKNANVHFVIAGGETVDAVGVKVWLLKRFGFVQNVQQEIFSFIQDNDLQDCITLTGLTLNIGNVYRCIDVLLFPSHFDAPGRPVFEAGFYSKPSIIAARNPTPDTFKRDVTGIAVLERSPHELADAILYLMNNPEVCEAMGCKAKELAEKNFTPVNNSRKVLNVYERLLGMDRG